MKALKIGLGILLVLIFMTLFLPSSLWMINLANQDSAVRMERQIHKAETAYAAGHSDSGFTCSLVALDLAPDERPQTDESSPSTWGHSGYSFELSGCKPDGMDSKGKISHFVVTAVPIALGKTGRNGYCGDETGQIKFDPAGGKDCRQPVR